MPSNTFKPVSSDPSIPARSPSPPHRFIEPLSPPVPAATLPPVYTGGKTTLVNTFATAPQWPETKARKTLNNNWDSWDSRIIAQTPHNAHSYVGHAQSQRSPSTIDALATVALATSPTYSPISPRGPRHDSLGHAFGAWPTHDARHQSPVNGYAYGAEERPSKRARSEAVPSPRGTFDNTRPATSHVPVTWSYNLEQAVDNGSKIYGSQASYHYPETRTTHTGANLYEAELLLGLGRERRHSSYDKGQPQQQIRGHSDQKDTGQLHLGEQLYRAVYGDYRSGDDIAVVDDLPLKSAETLSHPNHEMTSQNPTDAQTLSVEGTTQPQFSSASVLPQTSTPPEDQQTNSESSGKVIAKDSKAKKSKGAKTKRQRETSRNRKQDENLQSQTVPSGSGPTNHQLASPESLMDSHTIQGIESSQEEIVPETSAQAASGNKASNTIRERRYSDSEKSAKPLHVPVNQKRASSEPPLTPRREIVINFPGHERLNDKLPKPGSSAMSKKAIPVTTCKSCGLSQNPERRSEEEVWISCNGCDGWFHWACAGLKNEREVRIIDKFFCRECKSKHGATTYVRQSSRTKTTVDYAGLNEGILRTSDDNPEHHYIKLFKNGGITLQPERFPRMRPELVTAEYFEKCGGMKEPVVIPAKWNPRPDIPIMEQRDLSGQEMKLMSSGDGETDEDWLVREFEHESVPDEGQDKLDMVIPQGLTVRRVAELVGMEEKLEVIDVKTQEGGQKGWNLRRWADYFEAEGDKPVRNVISLEVSDTKLGRLIRRPKIVRDMDLQDSVWPADDQSRVNSPKVQFYCLMSVTDSFTDFHVDFGGSSVYYHILTGKKTFFFIPPEPKHLKKYEEWCMSAAQNYSWLGDQTKCCYRVDLSAGDTMLIPSGWIHSVWTPENSLVIGGNFLTRIHYENQFRVFEIEKATKVARKFRYPFFQKVMWYTAIRYLERDPLPPSVEQLFYDGKQFERSVPIYLDDSSTGERGTENYNARYYSEAELTGMSHLINYIWRTVLISNGKVDGVNSDTRNAVARSIPKGHGLGEPLEVAKLFAMWVAWKRGNEDIPQWAHPETPLPDSDDRRMEKKLSVAALKKMERQAAIEAYRIAPDRQSARQAMKAAEAAASKEPDHTSTPKTSVLGPKRIACDACRRRRIRCKHKEEAGASGSSTPKQRRNSSVLVGVVIDSSPNKSSSDVFERPTPQATPTSKLMPEEGQASTDSMSKKPRTKACVDCRKSKRRCIHDENGNIDPVKAAESPVPRGSANAKKRKSIGESLSPEISKRQKGDWRTADQQLAGTLVAEPNDTMAIDPALMAMSEDTITVGAPPAPMAPMAPIAPMVSMVSTESLHSPDPAQSSEQIISEDQTALAEEALRIAQEHSQLPNEHQVAPDFEESDMAIDQSMEPAIDPELETQLQPVEATSETIAMDPALDSLLQNDHQSPVAQVAPAPNTPGDLNLDPRLQTESQPTDAQTDEVFSTDNSAMPQSVSATKTKRLRSPDTAIDESGIKHEQNAPTAFEVPLEQADISAKVTSESPPAGAEATSSGLSVPLSRESSKGNVAGSETEAIKLGPVESLGTPGSVMDTESAEPAVPTTEPVETDYDTTAKTSTPRSEEDLTSSTSTSRKRAASSPLTDLAEDGDDPGSTSLNPTSSKRAKTDQSPGQQPSRHSSRSSKPIERFAPSSFDPAITTRRPSTASSSLSAADCVTLSAPGPAAQAKLQRRKSSTPVAPKAIKLTKQYGRASATPKKPQQQQQQQQQQTARRASAGSVGKGEGEAATEQREETQEERDAKLARELAGEWAGLRRRGAKA